VYRIALITPLAEPCGELVPVSEEMNVRGLVRVASIMSTIEKEPMNVGGAYRM
jgi:hypothetical protein